MGVIMRIARFIKPVGLGLVAVFALSLSTSAQDKPDKPAKPAEKPAAAPAKPATPATPAAPAAQKSSTAATGDTTVVAVTGLSKENSASARTALEGITHSVWRCPDCGMSQTEKGTCSMCNKELVAEKSPSLRNVTLDADKGTVTFALAPGQSVRLTEIESALTAQKVSIPRDKLTIASSSTLVVSGVSSEESAKKLETELKNSKLFDSVNTRLVGTGKPAELTVKGGTTPATRAKVEEALAKAGPDFKLVDIMWVSTTASATPAAPEKPKSKG
jgi:hypothetical protein